MSCVSLLIFHICLVRQEDCDPAPTVTCFNCKLDVSVNNIREHQESCGDDDELYVLFFMLKILALSIKDIVR